MPTVGAPPPARGTGPRRVRRLRAWEPVPPGWYQPAELALVFRVTPRTITNWARRGVFPGAQRVRQGSQLCLMVPAEDANRVLADKLRPVVLAAARGVLDRREEMAG